LNCSLVYAISYEIWSVWVLCCLMEVGVRSVWFELFLSICYFICDLVGVGFVLSNGGWCEVGVA
jgi:hypothetical protein